MAVVVSLSGGVASWAVADAIIEISYSGSAWEDGAVALLAWIREGT